MGITCDANALYVADTGNRCIRHINLGTGFTTTVAGLCGVAPAGFVDGAGGNASFSDPVAIAYHKSSSTVWSLYVSDFGAGAPGVPA
jgi:hypothetical protein